MIYDSFLYVWIKILRLVGGAKPEFRIIFSTLLILDYMATIRCTIPLGNNNDITAYSQPNRISDPKQHVLSFWCDIQLYLTTTNEDSQQCCKFLKICLVLTLKRIRFM